MIVFVPIMFRFQKRLYSLYVKFANQVVSLFFCAHISSFCGLLAHDVDPVEVLVVSGLGCNDSGGRDGWLGYHVVRNGPIEFLLLEVGHTRLFDTVGDADVDTVG